MDLAKLQKARILMLDDQVANTCLMTNFLERIGYSNLEALTDPTLLFDRITAFQPDLILLDLSMPKLDGFQVMEQMRQTIRAEERVPILVISGEATAMNKRKALAAGATDILAKPFDPSEMNMRIRNILEARFLRLQIEEQNRLLEDRVHERTQQLEQALEDIQVAQRQMVQQERLSAFAAMAGGVVHDFSNSLMAIIGYSDMLIAGDGRLLDDRNTAHEYLTIINRAGRDAAEVVSRLRDFYRPRDQADVFGPVELHKIAQEAILSTKPKWTDPNRPAASAIIVEAELQPVSPVQGSAAELRETLTNLIFNAVDAMPDGGKITLRTRMAGDVAILEITDNGPGMTPEVRSRCLDPFFSTKGDNGTGLGLAMVFGIIQRHQGKLEIETAIGHGTTFSLEFPVIAEQRDSALTPFTTFASCTMTPLPALAGGWNTRCALYSTFAPLRSSSWNCASFCCCNCCWICARTSSIFGSWASRMSSTRMMW